MSYQDVLSRAAARLSAIRYFQKALQITPRNAAEVADHFYGSIALALTVEDKLYGWSDPVESNAVEVHIHSLRKKLGADFIRNVRGVGWMVARGSAAATAASVGVHT